MNKSSTKTSVKPNIAKFEFEDEKFDASRSQILPWCQMINPQYGKDGIQPFGLAIKLNNAQAIGFKPDDDWQQVEYEFSSGLETVFMTNAPKLVIAKKGELCVRDRETGIKLGTFKENYDLFKSDKQRLKTFATHLIFLVGKDKNFLHDSPLRLTLSGAAGASFSKHYCEYQQGRIASGFIAEIEKAYAEFSNQPVSSKGPLFHAHGIFCPIIECEERGTQPNTALIASTVGYKHPTAANVTEYLIASDSPESAVICRTFEEYKDLGKDLSEEVNIAKTTDLEDFPPY